MASAITPRRHHISPSVADLDRQAIWCQQVLGFEAIIEQYEVPEPPVRTVVLEARTGTRVGLIERAGSRRSRDVTDPLDACRDQGYGHWALEVDDLDAAFAAWPPADGVRPGNLIALVQPPAAA
ncbi:VOC family protein [Streptomyces niveus]|uniref:VOC family protein n=1 Tax=Streptomyces niveus TaxID=193462 RepID=UPI003441F18C